MSAPTTFGIDADKFGMLTPSGSSPKDRLVIVSGTPPLTITHTLPRPPKRITIYGNTVDGMSVGDKTANRYRDHNTYIPVEANIEYAILRTAKSGYIRIALYDETYTEIHQIYGYRDYAYFITKPLQNGYLRIGGAANYAWITHPGSVNCVINNGILRKRTSSVSSDNNIIGANLIDSYNYEPYGYKIPISLDAKTIHIFSDVQLNSNDTLTLSPEAQTAIRNSTDISLLQDWSQEFDLPKADSISVTTNTAVSPSNISIRYYSRARI